MLTVKQANAAEFSQYYNALQMDFDQEELLPQFAKRSGTAIWNFCCSATEKPESRKVTRFAGFEMSTDMCS